MQISAFVSLQIDHEEWILASFPMNFPPLSLGKKKNSLIITVVQSNLQKRLKCLVITFVLKNKILVRKFIFDKALLLEKVFTIFFSNLLF